MSGQKPQPGDRQPSISRELEPDSGDVESVSSDILGQIVAHTASSLERTEDTDPGLKAALVTVARDHAGQPLVADGAGTALLEALLRMQYAFLASRPALLTKTARAVAHTLLADPAARLRVEHLWAKLQEEAA
jgi:hypothetical protein